MKRLLMLLILMGLFFVSGVQPMFMISIFIMIVLLLSYMVYNMMGGYWISYALMLVMLTGIMVLFTYMVSLLPNESFENFNLMYLWLIVVLLVGGYYEWVYKWSVSYISLNLWMSYFSMFNMFMVSFLLSIMLVVVWLSWMGYGAIRINY